MTEQEIIAEAKRRFTLGCEFYSAYKFPKSSLCVHNGIGPYDKEKEVLWNIQGKHTYGWLYEKGQWAEPKMIIYPEIY